MSSLLIETASLKCNLGHKKVQSSKIAQLMDSSGWKVTSLDLRALGELGVIKLLSNHFLRTALSYKL